MLICRRSCWVLLLAQVSRGAREVFELLPHAYVAPADVAELVARPPADSQHKLFGVVVRPEDALSSSSDGSTFDAAAYRADPSSFTTAPFALGVAPHASVLVNALNWDARYPRWLSADALRAAVSKGGGGGEAGSRLLMVSDLSCDPHGAVDLGAGRLSSSSAPYFSADAQTSLTFDDLDGRRPTMMAVPALAQQIPREASTAFSAMLTPLVPAMLAASAGSDGGGDAALTPELRAAAVTTTDGALAPRFEYISAALAAASRANGPGDGTAESGSGNHGTAVCLTGHLFDSGLINRALDLLEHEQLSFSIRGFDTHDDGTTSCTFEFDGGTAASALAVEKLEKLSGAMAVTAQASVSNVSKT